MLILVGKSCSGKTTIIKELIKLGFSPVISYTTRPIRNGETNGNEYKFIDEDIFNELERKGFFLKTTQFKVNNGDIWRYGIALKDISDDKVIIANPKELVKLYELNNIHPISFYLETNENIIWQRLIKRKDNIGEAQRRLVADRTDFLNISEYVNFIFRNNGELKPAILADMIKFTYEKYINNIA